MNNGKADNKGTIVISIKVSNVQFQLSVCWISKGSNTGLKRHHGEQIIIDFYFILFLGGSTIPLRLHSRRPEAAAVEDKCKLEARTGERE